MTFALTSGVNKKNGIPTSLVAWLCGVGIKQNKAFEI